jgi:hypothetical protein
MPESLAELLHRAEAERADLLSVSPGQRTPTWWEKSVIPLVYVKLAGLFDFAAVSDPHSPVAAANGQYLLVRREAYQRCGGHEAVKAAILEDVELARRIKAQGGKLIFLPGARWVRTRMYHSFREMWRGWTKNLYLLYEGNLAKMLAAVASLWFLDSLPASAFVVMSLWPPFSFPTAPTLTTLCLLMALTIARLWHYQRALKRLGFNPDLASYQPIGAALLGALMLNSWCAHRAAGGIEWKGRHYPSKGKA